MEELFHVEDMTIKYSCNALELMYHGGDILIININFLFYFFLLIVELFSRRMSMSSMMSSHVGSLYSNS